MPRKSGWVGHLVARSSMLVSGGVPTYAYNTAQTSEQAGAAIRSSTRIWPVIHTEGRETSQASTTEPIAPLRPGWFSFGRPNLLKLDPAEIDIKSSRR